MKVNDLERKLKVAEDELHEFKVSSRVATSRRAVLTGRRAKSANGAPRIWKEPADSVDVTDGWILIASLLLHLVRNFNVPYFILLWFRLAAATG